MNSFLKLFYRSFRSVRAIYNNKTMFSIVLVIFACCMAISDESQDVHKEEKEV